MQKLLLIFMVFLISNVTFAATEKQFINSEEVQEYLKYIDEPLEIQEARFEIFYNNIDIPYKIDISPYKDYFTDHYYNIKKSRTTKFRWIFYFSNGLYEWFKEDTKLRFIYDKGHLTYIVKEFYYKEKKIFICYLYDINGNLKYIQYVNYIKRYGKNSFWKNYYIFDIDKNYIGTWYKDNFYNKEGQIILKGRDFIPF